MELEVSTSPRSTWVWAPSFEEARTAQRIVEDTGAAARPAVGRNAEPRVLDLEIGVDAYNALTALTSAGYTLRWHSSQHPLNRRADLMGIPIADGV